MQNPWREVELSLSAKAKLMVVFVLSGLGSFCNMKGLTRQADWLLDLESKLVVDIVMKETLRRHR